MEYIFIILIGIALGFLLPHIFEIIGVKSRKQIKIFRDRNQNFPYYFTPQPPVHWFDFQGLINTFRRVSLSSDILSIIDKREVQANFGQDKKEELFNNRKNKDVFWLDFIADTGDGFDATTSVFYHLTRKNFSNKLGIDLEQGDALIIGGDLVYPDGSDKNYADRFKGPIRFVFPSNQEVHQPYLLAVPGNHDWYDGLTSFYRMMAQKDTIGNFKTTQNRSYFAYHLGFNHHILGLDNQLKGDLDLPQVDYFSRYVEKICRPGSHVYFIILVAEPYWYSFENEDFKKRRQRMDSLDYFVKMIRKKAIEKNFIHPTHLHFDIVLTGDMHHYSHYTLNSNDKKEKVKHYITSGGGGAFGHATGYLKDNLTLPKIGFSSVKFDSYKLQKNYPSKEDSNQFIGTNFLFFIRNYKFTSLILMLSLFSTFLLSLTSHPLFEFLLIALVPSILTATVVQVANPEPSKAETLHNRILYFSLFFVTLGISIIFNTQCFSFITKLHESHPHTLFIIQWVVPSLLQAMGMGIYFFIAYRVFGLHVTEISSGKIQEGRKNFLKFKITKDEITIYVLGIKEKYNWLKAIKKFSPTKLQKEMSVPTSFDENGDDEFLTKYFDNASNNIELIETINIKHDENN